MTTLRREVTDDITRILQREDETGAVTYVDRYKDRNTDACG